MVTLADRHDRGHGTQGIKYPPAFNEWCNELFCISPTAYRTFRSHFGGRTERSFHQIRSKIPIFHPGITSCAYTRARQYCLDYHYPLDGPLAIGVDDTALLEAIRPFFDPIQNKWYAIGLVGDLVEVIHDSADEFRQQLKSTGHEKAEKLRLWTLQIPLSHVPPLILAVAAISSATSSSTLAQMDEDLLRVLLKREEPLSVISIGSDGAISERKARNVLIAKLVNAGEGEINKYHIKHPDGHSPPITIPLLRAFGQVITIVQDSKHCRKTLRNNLFSGARAFVLARHVTFYQQVRDITNDTAHSPLHRRDVEHLDRQDDRAAERLFSSATLAYTLSHLGKSSLGLTIYIFVFGDLVDAYQSRNISHSERVIMVLRAKFFKDLWKSFLLEGKYTEQRYFISRDADNIIDTLVIGLLGLILIHRDTLDKPFPLMPWTHGSESNEHVFGLMRSLISDFTMLDVLRMVPKLTVRLQAACRSRYQHFGETAAGYSHTYFDDDDAPSHLFSQFPSNQAIDSLAKDAYGEATYLWSLLGYDPCEAPIQHKPQPADSVSDSEDLNDDTSEGWDDNTRISDRRELLNAVDASSDSLGHGVPRKNNKQLNEYMFAVAALNLQDLTDLYELHYFSSNEALMTFPANHFQILTQHLRKTLQRTFKAFYEDRWATPSRQSGLMKRRLKIKTPIPHCALCPSHLLRISHFLWRFDSDTRQKKPRREYAWPAPAVAQSHRVITCLQVHLKNKYLSAVSSHKKSATS
jgi:hypothetical protein